MAAEPNMLPEPRTPFQQLLRRLADAAMHVNHHDIDEGELEYIHEVKQMEIRFDPLIRAYVRSLNKSKSLSASGAINFGAQ